MADSKETQAPMRVVVRPLDLSMHEVQVEMTLPADIAAQGPIMALPAWTPGSYLVRDYARFLDGVSLKDALGEEHRVSKLDKQRWKLSAIKGSAHLRYRLYCNELTVRTNHVDSAHAFFTGAATFLYPEKDSGRSFEIRFEGFPEAWKVSSCLQERKGVYIAADVDMLMDSPFELGTFTLHTFDLDGTRFEFAITGRHSADEARLVEGCRRVVEACGRMFGTFPFSRYVFQLTFSPKARGGLEHRNGTALLADPHRMDTAEGYYDLFALMAHEFFHAWNVKRLRDVVLGPFDYQRENYTHLLWFHEGLTSYMQYLIVLKANLVPWSWVARKLARLWTEHHARHGRHRQSLEEASFDAWIRFYRPTEFSANSSVSYYDKGCLVAWMMDGALRLATKGGCGVEDLIVQLWQEIGDGHLRDHDIRAVFKRLSKLDPKAFWKDFIEGTAELDPTLIEQAFGLKLEQRAPWDVLSAEERLDPVAVKRAKVYTGLSFIGDGCVIENVLPGSPAAHGGLGYGHEILAVNGWRTVGSAEIQKRFADLAPGQKVIVLAAEHGRVYECEVKLTENPERITRLLANATPTDVQGKAFKASYGGEHPSAVPSVVDP